MGNGILESKYLNESICLNKTTFDTTILVLLPPAWVFMDQKKNKKKTTFSKFLVILLNVILTGLFYLPGLLHALYLMNTNVEKNIQTNVYSKSMYTKKKKKKK